MPASKKSRSTASRGKGVAAKKPAKKRVAARSGATGRKTGAKREDESIPADPVRALGKAFAFRHLR